MLLLFCYIILKRLALEKNKDATKLFFHLGVILLFFVVFRLQSYNHVATRVTPILIAVLSYYAHTRYLFIKRDNYSSKNDCSNDGISVDTLVKQVVLCGAMFINHMYIDVFLTVTKRDSLVLNAV